MPDATNIVQIQEQKAQESAAAYKRGVVHHALEVLDPTFRFESRGFEYLTLVERLRRVLDAELATLAAPVPSSEPS